MQQTCLPQSIARSIDLLGDKVQLGLVYLADKIEATGTLSDNNV